MKEKSIIITIIIILTTMSYMLLIHDTKESVEIVSSLIEKQKDLESEIVIEGHTIDDPKIIVNPYEISPLTALILFETEEEVSPTIKIVGKDKHSTYEMTFSENTKHYLNVYGLYPDTENTVIISYDDVEKEVKIKTEPLPEDLTLPSNIEADKSELDNELYFFTPALQSYPVAFDVNGDVRWYLTEMLGFKIDRLENGNLLLSTERAINPPYYFTGLYEIDLLGKIYTEYSLPGGYHHDYFELENGNLLVATDDFDSDDGTVEDITVELDRQTGEIVKTFDFKDILIMTDGKSEDWIDYDWFHQNSVWYDKETNSIIASGRHQDAVISVDYDTGELNWIIGDPTNWSEEYQKYFFTPIGKNFEWQWSQHAAMVTPEGYIFILDNGNNKSKIEDEYVPATESYTRGVIYDINTEDMTIKQVYQYGKERGSDFYSPYISDVDYLGEDHYLIHSGGISYIDGEIQNVPAGFLPNAELNSISVEEKDGEVIFEIELPSNYYRVEKMSLYENDEYQQKNAESLGTLGETIINDKTFGVHPLINRIDEEYESHQISITKEIDRLVVEGQFKQGTVVEIILNQDFISNFYTLKVSKKPYTALCIDVFTEEETENGITVTKYINQEGLKGKYNIYLKIDDQIYNTEQHVEF